MSLTDFIQPRLSFLSEEHIELIHQNALRILSEVGGRFQADSARQILAQAEGTRIDESSTVTFTPELVAWALDAAPAVIDIFTCKGEPAFRLGSDRTRFGIGVTTLYYRDSATKQLSAFSCDNKIDMVCLGNHMPNFDFLNMTTLSQNKIKSALKQLLPWHSNNSRHKRSNILQ